jgi:hypothetical protein
MAELHFLLAKFTNSTGPGLERMQDAMLTLPIGYRSPIDSCDEGLLQDGPCLRVKLRPDFRSIPWITWLGPLRSRNTVGIV